VDRAEGAGAGDAEGFAYVGAVREPPLRGLTIFSGVWARRAVPLQKVHKFVQKGEGTSPLHQ